MNQVIIPHAQANAIKIDGAIIRQDQFGRYCLNDLHKASGSELKNKPSNFLQNDKTQELAHVLTDAGNPSSPNIEPIRTIRGGLHQGTYVVKELVYAYAMWISPAFHLKVIRTFDALATQTQPAPDLNNPAQLRELLLGYAEQNIQLSVENRALNTAIDNITATDSGVKFQQACKILGVKQNELAIWLRTNGWDRYLNEVRTSTHKSESRGYCETKYTQVDSVKASGEPYKYTRVEFFILPKGMAVLAKCFGGQS